MKITQRQIAHRANIKTAYLSELLNGRKKNPSIEITLNLHRACQELGLPFTAEDWAFRASSIKDELHTIKIINQNTLRANKKITQQK
ncbi:MAG: helix-turn-helix domain-containing protein [Desulfamplus sp.]|nr:helix-turn-helix domain-containing protein [Desulfamplus sp.]